ncbi:RNA-binding protein 39-like [Dioscorea cayenensis subsp. rotundata]|uniref:RNA-binding protein 39-like n=1 Tax=Dioscorea cayennensis subsp. rotundata TaxID=55577 RepID=A0AB40CIT6_DIOCR|nr:RNA-binding protein 39-like [Dioscorea cayenensis subsp. rotundata]
MDFDEYEYLEKAVENPDAAKEGVGANGNGVRAEDEKDRSRSSKRRGDEAERESERGLKRSRSESHRDQRSRDGERERDRHRSGREHRDHVRDERNGKEDRERGRNSGRESEREKEREKSPRRKSRPERLVEEDRHRSKERSGERGLREKEKERDFKERDRETRRPKEKKEDRIEPEADPERDQRTVFAYQISLKADERDVYEFFSRAGKVRDVRLIMDRNSRRSKGVGYIEFYDAMSVPMAIALSGQPLLGQPVMVKPSEAEKNLVQSTAAAGVGGVIGPYSGGARRLYVGNLHYNISEDQLRQVFEPFGSVELVQLPADPETGHCKGYGFVQFARLEDARAAQSLNGQIEIAGKPIKVSAVSDQVGIQEAGTNAGDFDDDDGGGLGLNARSRALLMQKLDRSGTTTSATVNSALPTPATSVLGMPPVVAPLLQPPAPSILGLHDLSLQIPPPAPTIDIAGVPSECLLLKNMFDPSIEAQPDFDIDIKEDVRDECSKFGTVKHIFVDKNSAGFVYLRFDSPTAAINAQHALHGRWFAGKMITATFMLPEIYETKFPANS